MKPVCMLPTDNTLFLHFQKLICSDDQFAQYEKMISADELMRANQFSKALDRRRFVISKAITRHILSTYLDKSAEKIQFSLGEHGKPSLVNSTLQFSVSHSQDVFLIGVIAHQQVGVDIEKMRQRSDTVALAKRFFAENEYRSIESASDFYQIWTCKEAFIKATGLGLTFGLSQFEIDMHAQPSVLSSVFRPEYKAADWTVRPVAVPVNYDDCFAAFCVNGHMKSLVVS